MTRKFMPLAALGLCAALAACGGNSGGGGNASGNGTGTGSGADGGTNVTQASIDAPVEGVWHGSSTRGNALDLLLLDKGEMYILFLGSVAGDLAFDQGSYTVKGDQLTIKGLQYSLRPITTGSVIATVVSGAAPSIKGSALNAGGSLTETFSATPLSATDSTYKYTQAATLASISGPWSSGNVLGQSSPFTFNIDANGVLSATTIACSFVGKLTPRASGKNVFDFSMEANQSPCTSAGKSYSGVAISYRLANGKQQLIATLRTADQSAGSMLVAQR